MKRISFDNEQIREISNLYLNEKVSVDDIAKKFSVGRKKIYTLLKKNGIGKDDDQIKKERSEKIKNTNLQKYGVKSTLNIKEVKEKIKKTCLEKYGVEYAIQSNEVKDKVKNTCIEKYGVVSTLQTDYVKEKSKQTCLKKYGVEYANQSEIIKEKKKQTYLNKYSVENSSQKDVPLETLEILSSKEKLQNYIELQNCKITKDLADKLNVGLTTIHRYLNKYDLYDLIDYKISSGESELKEYIISLGINVVKDKTILDGKEIDIYCPDYKIGIEFNGDYWHSDAVREKNYHYDKSLLAQEKGVRLIHIYEHEWNDPIKQKIIKSMLRIAFGKVENRIYARNCEVREITNIEARDFNNNNHLQGHKNAQVTYGLFYNNELVQLMSFSYYPQKRWWEIERGCPGSNNVVVGGVSKLFKHFLREYNPDKVFSYCDFNKFDGVGYEKLGMKLLGYTGPDMKWLMNDGTVKNRQPKRRKELSENARGKIWGAGSKRYLWKKEADIKYPLLLNRL